MRIEKHVGHNLASRSAEIGKEKAKGLEALATGKRINRASDDAAGLSLAREFEKRIRAYRNASENIQAGISAMAIADGGSGAISDMLQRQRELAVQSANGALNQDQRKSLDQEFQTLTLEIDRISKSTDYNGQNLLDGTGKLADGTGRVFAGQDADGAILFGASDLSASGLSLGSAGLGSPEAALRAMDSIDSAMRRVNEDRSNRGALANRLDHAMADNENQAINTTKGLSAVEDLDFAVAMTDKVRNDILQNSGAAAISQFNQLTRSHLLALLQ